MANKMIFKQEYEGWSSMHGSAPPSTVTMELSGDLSLTDVLERFQDFLKGCGYHFDGTLDIVYDEVDEITDDLDNLDSSYPDGVDYWNTDNMNTSFGAASETFTVSDNIDLGNVNLDIKLSADDNLHSAYYWDTERNK
jgi:hypothetical protein